MRHRKAELKKVKRTRRERGRDVNRKEVWKKLERARERTRRGRRSDGRMKSAPGEGVFMLECRPPSRDAS